ncbi:MAG TPA: CocE/NonD family hydrolase, partial [Spirochaetota bacterium]|nr:CocE/NonD family hydrolase [Spirochaetota bacterium]
VEHYDMKYVIDDFIPSLACSDGKVGMVGGSYLGITQLLAAGLIDRDASGEPVHLKAILPQVPMADVYRDIVMHGGNIDLLFIPMWLGIVDMLAALPPLLVLGEDGVPTAESLDESTAILNAHFKQMLVSTSWIFDTGLMNEGDFYTKRSAMIYWPVKPAGGWGFAEGSRTMPSKLPVMTVGGWFDIFTRGTINTYQYGLSAHDQSDKRLIIGEFYHLEGATGMGLNALMTSKLTAKWFDWKIKGIDDPVMEEYPVMLYVMGENKWRGEKTWPLAESRTSQKTFYLTKQNPTPVDGDWYSDENLWDVLKKYTDNNLGLSETPDYDGDNPVLRHDPTKLHGLNSRASTRWLMGIEALVADISKFFLRKNIDASQWYEDERSDEKNCLTFTTEPLEEDLEIIGPLTVTFWAKTEFGSQLEVAAVNLVLEQVQKALKSDTNMLYDAMNKKDVQWAVELNDVFEDGRARNITSGWLSAWHRKYDPTGKTTEYWEGPWYNRQKVVEHANDPSYVAFDPFYRNPDINPKPINEGELYQYTVELWPTCNVFKKGHRVRVSISASDFPHLLPILYSSNNTIVIDENHQAKIDFTTTNSNNEGSTWTWIGDTDAANDYVLEGASTGCGSQAVAGPYRGTPAGYLGELLGLLFIMAIPLSLIACGRFLRRRFS